MNSIISLISILFIIHGSTALFGRNTFLSHSEANVKLDGDVGEPLYLTPYIESGRVAEAQKLSRVSGLPSAPNITHHSGFLTVNKEYKSNMFFWYFPALVCLKSYLKCLKIYKNYMLYFNRNILNVIHLICLVHLF